jgi:hypothetical protein
MQRNLDVANRSTSAHLAVKTNGAAVLAATRQGRY